MRITFTRFRCAGLLLACLLVIAGAGPALAHAQFRGSDPAANAVVDAVPSVVALRFNEPVGVLKLEWLAPDGTRSEAVRTETGSGEELRVLPPQDAGRGTYVLSWRIVSTDGHPVGGTLVFSVGEVTGTAPPEGTGHAAAAIVTRFLASLAMVLAVGAGLFAAYVAPLSEGSARLGRIAAVATPPLAALAVGTYGLDLLDAPAGDLLAPATWLAAVSQPHGWGLLVGAAGAVLALFAFTGRAAPALSSLVLGAVSLAVSGHSATGGGLFGQPIMVVHAAALIFWLGALPPLLSTVTRADGLPALRRFSDLAFPAVVALIATGIALTLRRDASPIAIAGSDWGKLLAAKLVLVAAMLTLALRNKTKLTPALRDEPVRAERQLRRSIGAEILLGAAVLLIAMGFRLTPPPGAEASTAPLHLHLHGAEAMVDMQLSPAPPGAVDVSLVFMDGSGAPLTPMEATLSFSDPVAGIGPIRAEAHPEADGSWSARSLTLPTPGPWDVKASILISDFKTTTLGGTLEGPDPPR